MYILTALWHSDSVRRGARTFLISFLVVLVPGALGWLNALTSWASSEGQTPFPDAHSLAYLGVSAIVAGFIAIGNLLWNWVEDATGKGLLRDVGPQIAFTPDLTSLSRAELIEMLPAGVKPGKKNKAQLIEIITAAKGD